MQDQNLNFIEFPYFDDLIQLQIYATGNENLLNDNIERIAKAKGPLSRRVVDDRNTPSLILCEENALQAAHAGVICGVHMEKDTDEVKLSYRNFFPVLKGIRNPVNVYQILNYPEDMSVSIAGETGCLNLPIDFFDPYGIPDREGLKLGSDEEFFYLSGLALMIAPAGEYAGRSAKIRSYDEIKDRYLKEHEGSSEEDFIKEYLKEHQYDPLTAVAGVNTYQIRGTVEKTQSCTYEGTRMLCLRVLLSQFGLFRLRINIYASEKILSNSVIEEGDDIYAIAFLTGTRQNLFFDQESNNREAKLQSL